MYIINYFKERLEYFKLLKEFPEHREDFEKLTDKLLIEKIIEVERYQALNIGMTYGEKNRRTFYKVHNKNFERMWTGAFADEYKYTISLDWLLKIMIKISRFVKQKVS